MEGIRTVRVMRMKRLNRLLEMREFVEEGIYHTGLLLMYFCLTILAVLVLPIVLIGRAIEGNGKVYKHNRSNRNK
jgi:uncharacterized membrane protein YozB (DUF420 family)